VSTNCTDVSGEVQESIETLGDGAFPVMSSPSPGGLPEEVSNLTLAVTLGLAREASVYLQRSCCTQFTCFTGTKVQILTRRKARGGVGKGSERVLLYFSCTFLGR